LAKTVSNPAWLLSGCSAGFGFGWGNNTSFMGAFQSGLF
jgi:hypothetical protein